MFKTKIMYYMYIIRGNISGWTGIQTFHPCQSESQKLRHSGRCWSTFNLAVHANPTCTNFFNPIKYPACIQYKQNIYFWSSHMKKETLYNLTLNWFSLRCNQVQVPVHMFHHLNLPVQVNKVLMTEQNNGESKHFAVPREWNLLAPQA